MHITEFFVPGSYENPLSPSGRARTIAAFLLAQGDAGRLGQGEMRRDVLNSLMSTSAVNHWLNTTARLEKTRKVGAIQLLRLTDAGIIECTNSLNAGGNVSTTMALVNEWKEKLKNGSPNLERKTFSPL